MNPLKDVINKRFRDVLNKRNIEDITLKMEKIKKIPQDELIRLFLEMCDLGIELYVKEELKKKPNSTPEEIMKTFYQKKLLKQKRE